MTESALSRGLNGWRFIVLRRVRHRRLVHRCTNRMLHTLLSATFDCWVVRTDRDYAQVRTHQLEEQLQASQLELQDIREIMTREVTELQRTCESLPSSNSFPWQRLRKPMILSLQRLRGKLGIRVADAARSVNDSSCRVGRQWRSARASKSANLQEDLENGQWTSELVSV